MTNSSKTKLEILADPEVLAHRVANWMLELATLKKGVFVVALSGGSTPQRLYELLAKSPCRDTFPWARTHWFWGDERFVPYDDLHSNYRMVREAMLLHAPIPEANIHAVPTHAISPEAAVLIYEQQLKLFYGADSLEVGRPFFDVVLLGLGEDGHTASLFPNTSVLGVRDRWVAAVRKTQSETRITLTYPVLESSEHVAFLIIGKDKRGIFDRLRHSDSDLPAARLHPTGELIWFADAAAASGASS
jgi:6-phosphogluconolactonase